MATAIEPGYASRGGFERVEPLGEGFVRGPARLLVAEYATAFPTEINSIINLEKEGNWKTEKQKIKKAAEEPGEGSYYLGFSGYATGKIEFGAEGKKVLAELEALPTIGTGNIKIIKGESKKIGEEEFEFEFIGELKDHAQPFIEVLHNTLKKEVKAVPLSVERTQTGKGEYDPQPGWRDLGSTKGGIKITRNNTESLIDIDQIQAAVAALPDEWEMEVECPFAETTPEKLEIAWEGLKQTTQSPSAEVAFPEGTGLAPEEKVTGFGNPLEYQERRLAVIYRVTLGSNKGKLRAYCFRKTTRKANASSIDFMKTGNLATVNMGFRCFAEPVIANPKLSMGLIYSQKYF